MPGLLGDEWWRNADTVHSVASHAEDQGELRTAKEAIDFYEKPWKFDELHTLWAESDES